MDWKVVDIESDNSEDDGEQRMMAVERAMRMTSKMRAACR